MEFLLLNPDNKDALLILNFELIKQGKKPLGGYSCPKELVEACKNIISNWDIRQVRALAELFPNIVPKWIANCKVDYVNTKYGVRWVCYK